MGALAGSNWAGPGRWTKKVHALTDVVRRPHALMLTPGDVSDIKAVPDLREHAGRTRYPLGAEATMLINCAVLSMRQAPSPLFLDAATGSEPFATTSSNTAPAALSRK